MAGAISRRSTLAALGSLALSHGAASQSAAWLPGVQLYTARDLLRRDLPGTLRRLAEMGYREVELFGPVSPTVRTMAENLRRFGLAAPAMHAGYEELRDTPDSVLADARVLGANFVVCPSIDAALRRTPDGWKKVCRDLAVSGRALREHGVTLAYHNHDFEFAAFADGTTPFGLMMAETDPRDLKLELDVYWAARAGLDPVRTLQARRDRIVLLHLKDLGAGDATVELGAGRLDFAAIVRTALAGGVKHLFVEQDNSADPLRSLATSLRYLQRLPADIRPS